MKHLSIQRLQAVSFMCYDLLGLVEASFSASTLCVGTSRGPTEVLWDTAEALTQE